VNGLFAAGAAFGSIGQGWLSEAYGRKMALFVASAVTLVGGVLVAGAANIPVLVVFRFVQGVGLGILMACVPLYIVEVSPPHHRGFLGGCTAVSFAIGYVGCVFIPHSSLPIRLRNGILY
jgi:MFS family permease